MTEIVAKPRRGKWRWWAIGIVGFIIFCVMVSNHNDPKTASPAQTAAAPAPTPQPAETESPKIETKTEPQVAAGENAEPIVHEKNGAIIARLTNDVETEVSSCKSAQNEFSIYAKRNITENLSKDEVISNGLSAFNTCMGAYKKIQSIELPGEIAQNGSDIQASCMAFVGFDAYLVKAEVNMVINHVDISDIVPNFEEKYKLTDERCSDRIQNLKSTGM